MAALNWTDEESIERRAVFYQMHGALFVSQAQGTGQNATWTQLNISDQFMGGALSPRNGTPLAAGATPWQAGKGAPWDAGEAFAVTLYYLNEDNQVCQLSSSVGDLSTWQGTEVFVSSPSDQSQLAACASYFKGTTASFDVRVARMPGQMSGPPTRIHLWHSCLSPQITGQT
jgi:hypothetical protein